MRLVRARRALVIANRAFGTIQESIDDPVRFKDELVPFRGLVARVGSIIDGETRGHRLPAFSAFWKGAASDARFEFAREWRNSEFKDALSRARPQQRGYLVAGTEGSAARVVFRDDESFIVLDVQPPNRVETKWTFVGGQFDGDDLIDFLAKYLAWLRELIVEAERLTT